MNSQPSKMPKKRQLAKKSIGNKAVPSLNPSHSAKTPEIRRPKASVSYHSPAANVSKPNVSPFRKLNKKPSKSEKAKKAPRKRKSYAIAALREIRLYQRTTGCLIPRKRMMTVIKEIIQQVSQAFDIRLSSTALEALREAAEYYAIDVLENANLGAIQSKRVTLLSRDMALVKRIRG